MDWLKKLDPDAVSLQCGDGAVWALPGLQGRIVCSMDGELLHRLDRDLAATAKPGTFNNVGGNSLWPAPEGGPVAFNYYQKDPAAWGVQEAVNSQFAVCTECSGTHAVMEKTMSLTNRTGADMLVAWRREIRPADLARTAAEYSLKATGYESEDTLLLQKPFSPEEALIAAWSLEQLPLSPDAYGFMVFDKAVPGMVNTGYYGDPVPYLDYAGNRVIFRFDSPSKLQIGADARSNPRLIGGCIPSRDLLILRETAVVPGGTYIDIADNEQPAGPFAAGDAYSIFYGAELDFFELETIAPVIMEDGLVRGSLLQSRSMFFRGRFDDLARMMMDKYGFQLQQGVAK